MWPWIALLCSLLVLQLVPSTQSFYLPGVAPRDFQTGETLHVKVNKLSSTKTQLPYDYYFLNYCKPHKIVNSAENLGEVLRGDRIENSVYTFKMGEEELCKVACRVKLDPASAKNFKQKIDDDYRVNMILDNLPVAVPWERREGERRKLFYKRGFPVGFKQEFFSKKMKYFIHNHLSFRVVYHKDPETDLARIVGFEVTPSSIKHKAWDDDNTPLTCDRVNKDIVPIDLLQSIDTDKEIVFTYDVSFEPSDIKWASRWDTYLLMNDDQIHWFSIINSLIIVLFLSGMVAMIMHDKNGVQRHFPLFEKSSGAVPFGTMFALLFLWFGVSFPLVFLRSFLGFKKPATEDPVKTNKIPRPIPDQPWYMNPILSILVGGLLPFGAVFIELFFILTSIWLNQFYYIFGFLFIVFVILVVTCAELAIVLCYFQLCNEDYYWWWRAYLTAGSSALYLFLYSAFYFFAKLEITKPVSGILYFGYMMLGSYAFFVLTGTVGFYGCLWFVRKIYSSVKID